MSYTLFPNIPYCQVGSETLKLDHYRAGTPSGRVLLSFHGGQWLISDKSAPWNKWPEGIDKLTLSGIDIVSADYRLGPTYLWPAMIQDALSALRWIHEHADANGWDHDKVGAFGVSSGAHLALMIHSVDPTVWPTNGCNEAGAMDFAAVATYAAPSDLTQSYFCGNPTQAQAMAVFGCGPACDANAQSVLWAASPLGYLTGIEVPVGCWHGTADLTIPPSESSNYVATAQGLGVDATYTAIIGAPHTFGGMTVPQRRSIALGLASWLQSKL